MKSFASWESEGSNTGTCAARHICLVIGPEGGFTLDEAELLRQHGARSVTLGPRILRAETAAIAAMSAVQYELGDLG